MSRKPVPEEKNESEVTSACTSWAELQGWRMYRNHQGMGNKKGRPDWEAVKPFKGLGITIYVEFKGPKGKLSDDQEEYTDGLMRQKCIIIVAKSLDEFKADLAGAEQRIKERMVS